MDMKSKLYYKSKIHSTNEEKTLVLMNEVEWMAAAHQQQEIHFSFLFENEKRDWISFAAGFAAWVEFLWLASSSLLVG